MRSVSSRALQRIAHRAENPTRLLSRPHRRRLATAAPERDPVEFDQISTLPNGVRVATEALPGPFSGIGVYIDAGSRYENEDLRGVSHIIDRLAFKSTGKRSADDMLETLESLGGNIHCASSREALMYQSASFNSAVQTTMGLLAETIREPKITDQEVEQQLETAEYEVGEIWSKPELILPELVHLAAYKDNTLGNPLLCPQERFGHIDRNTIQRYRNAFFRPERTVIAFAGVNHQQALRLSEQYFGDMKAQATASDGSGLDNSFAESTPSSESVSSPLGSISSSSSSSSRSSKLLSKIPFIKNLSTSAPAHASLTSIPGSTRADPIPFDVPSHYTGGFLSLPAIPPPANPALPRVSHIHLGFEALPISSDDIYALATLQTLLGGGGSFSAGGPGKGMFSRLYTHVLNQYHWVESCVSFNHSYTDSGLFGISASCIPQKVGEMLEVMCRELKNLTLDSGFAALNTTEVNRAKNQLKSSLLMNLESRMVELEDLGRQVQVHGRKVGVKEMCARIDALTVYDLRRVAKEIVGGEISNKGQGSGKPVVVIQEGDVEGYKRKEFAWDEIQERIAKWKLGRR